MNDKEEKKKEEQSLPAPTELERCMNERDEYLDMAKRIKAEFINYKKDEEKRFHKIRSYANLGVILKVITILDGFNEATKPKEKREETYGEWMKGVLNIKRQLEDLLVKEGVEKIKVKSGDAFDPEVHEGLITIPSEIEEGMVAEEVRVGYMLNGLVIRPSQVKVSRGKST